MWRKVLMSHPEMRLCILCTLVPDGHITVVSWRKIDQHTYNFSLWNFLTGTLDKYKKTQISQQSLHTLMSATKESSHVCFFICLYRSITLCLSLSIFTCCAGDIILRFVPLPNCLGADDVEWPAFWDALSFKMLFSKRDFNHGWNSLTSRKND